MDVFYGCAVSVIGASNTVNQIALIEAFKHPEFMQEYGHKYDYRRHQAYRILNEVPGVSLKLPESGFMAWVDVSKLGDSSEICKILLDEAKVSVNDGKNYGPGGEGHFRIILGVYQDDQKVVKVLEKIALTLKNIALKKGIK